MSGLADTGAGLDLWNLEYHQSVTESHPNLVLKFVYLKDLEDVDPFNISGVDGVKEVEQVKGAGGCYRSNYLQNSPCGKHKTSDSIPLSWRRGGIHHHIFIAIHADN